ncbi:MAG TPA: hypothetical protein VEK14_04700 [Rhodomicrobium sp.]|nr:hypothetical protein [Rhodomicrobium sp.]
MPVNPPFRDEAVEHPPLVEAAHFYEPIDGGNALANGEAIRGNAQGDDPQINIRREPPVQVHFRAACHLPLRERRKIEIGETHRLFQFENAVAGEKHP